MHLSLDQFLKFRYNQKPTSAVYFRDSDKFNETAQTEKLT